MGLAAGWLIAVLLDRRPARSSRRPGFPRLDGVAVTTRVLAASGGAALVAVLLAGLLPAWRGSRGHVSAALKDDDGRSAGETSARLRTTLLVVEAALALVLVVGALLLARSVDRLQRVDAGYDPTNVLTARIELARAPEAPDQHAAGGAASAARRAALVDAVLRRVRALPGVEAAGAGNMAPFGDSIALASFDLPGGGGKAEADSHVVTPGLAEALRLRLVEGRFFTAADPASRRTGPRQRDVRAAALARRPADRRPRLPGDAVARRTRRRRRSPASCATSVRPARAPSRARRSISSPAPIARSPAASSWWSAPTAIRCSSSRRCATSCAPRIAAPPCTRSARWPGA